MLEIVEVTNMKKSGVSRVRNKMVLVLVIANAMLFLTSVVTKATNLMNLSVLLFLPIMALLIATNRCPHCGKYFRGVYWAKEAGTCQKCGMRGGNNSFRLAAAFQQRAAKGKRCPCSIQQLLFKT